MENGIKIIDNFLDENYFSQLENLLMGFNFPWYYNPGIVDYDDTKNFQFTHLFYRNGSSRSSYFEVLNPCLNKLNLLCLIRIKANLLTKTEFVAEHGMHTDIITEKCFKTAILYLNTNNGYTKFKNGDKVESVRNRIVIFNSEMEHTGTTCTDQKIRVVVNFNYFEK